MYLDVGGGQGRYFGWSVQIVKVEYMGSAHEYCGKVPTLLHNNTLFTVYKALLPYSVIYFLPTLCL